MFLEKNIHIFTKINLTWVLNARRINSGLAWEIKKLIRMSYYYKFILLLFSFVILRKLNNSSQEEDDKHTESKILF